MAFNSILQIKFYKVVFGNFGVNLVLRGLNMCLNLAMFFLIARYLTLEEFGFFGVMMTYFFLITFIANQSLDNYSGTLKFDPDHNYFIKSIIFQRITKSWIGFLIITFYLLFIKELEIYYFLIILLAGISMLVNFDWYFISRNLYRRVIYRQLSITMTFIFVVVLIEPNFDKMLFSYSLILILSTFLFQWKQILVLFKKTQCIPFKALDLLPDIRFLVFFCIHIFHNIIFILSFHMDETLIGEYSAAYRIFTIFISLGTIYTATNQKKIVSFFRSPSRCPLQITEFSLVILVPVLLWIISFHFLVGILYDFKISNFLHYYISFGLFISFFTINQVLLLGFLAKGFYKFPFLIYFLISLVGYTIILLDFFNSVLIYIYIVSIGELIFFVASVLFHLDFSFSRAKNLKKLIITQ